MAQSLEGLMKVPDEIRTRHEPMNTGDDGYIICARCDEIWPCDAAQLIILIEGNAAWAE